MKFTYVSDDWLVIRKDENGHEACINTEMWDCWDSANFNDLTEYEQEQAKIRVIAFAATLPESAWLLMNCSTGWCTKCGMF